MLGEQLEMLLLLKDCFLKPSMLLEFYNTLAKRKTEGETIRLGEIWALDKVLHFTDDELLQMFGRGETHG